MHVVFTIEVVQLLCFSIAIGFGGGWRGLLSLAVHGIVSLAYLIGIIVSGDVRSAVPGNP